MEHSGFDWEIFDGVLIVAAAGNSGDGDPDTNDVEYPAKYTSVIAVGATASDDSSPVWSSEGSEVEVSAPGEDIYSTYKGNAYTTMSGTSMATPHVTGVVALMLASGVDPSNVRARLQATADDLDPVGYDNFYGYGLINAGNAVN